MIRLSLNEVFDEFDAAAVMLEKKLHISNGPDEGNNNEAFTKRVLDRKAKGAACLYCVAQIQPLAQSSTKSSREWNVLSKLSEEDEDGYEDEEEEMNSANSVMSQEIKLQSELTAAQYTISMLRKKITELNKQSLNMIPVKVHDEMLQRANDRANLAERKVSILEQEVKQLRADRRQPRPPSPPPSCVTNTKPVPALPIGEGYEEPHRDSRHALVENYKTSHVIHRSKGIGVMPSVATSSTRDRSKTTNDLSRQRNTSQHTLVLANGHANVTDRERSPGRTLPGSNFARGVSVMPSVAPQPVMPSIATVKSTTKNSHFEDYPNPHVFTGSKTLGRTPKHTATIFRKNNGTIHCGGTVGNSNVERLAQPKARRRPSVHSLVTQSIVNIDDQRERELLEEQRLQEEREEAERLEQERVDVFNAENKSSKRKGRFRKTSKASKGGKSFLSRNNTSKPKAAKSGTQKSLLSRMHTKFFTTRRKNLRHIYDLPEVSSLETCSLTSDYETPSQKMQNFAATPLICQSREKKALKPCKPRVHPRVKTLKKSGTVKRRSRSKRSVPSG